MGESPWYIGNRKNRRFIAFFKIKAHIHKNETTLNSPKAKHSERRVGSRSEDLALNLRKRAFTFDQSFSIGFRSGLYGGR